MDQVTSNNLCSCYDPGAFVVLVLVALNLKLILRVRCSSYFVVPMVYHLVAPIATLHIFYIQRLER